MKKLPWNIRFAKAWEKMMPPARPNKGELRIIDKIIKSSKKKDMKILILGCTAEFRDLIAKNNSTSYCVDINPNLFNALKYLMKEKPKKEVFIASDWINIKTKEKFDLILGHQSLNMLPVEKWDSVMKSINNILTKDGKVALITTLRLPKDSKLNPIDGFIKYRKSTIKNKKVFEEAHLYVVIGCYNKFKRYLSLGEWRDEVKDLFKKKMISKKERDDYLNHIAQSKLILYVPLIKSFKDIVKKYFTTEKIQSSERFYTKNQPVFVLRKK